MEMKVHCLDYMFVVYSVGDGMKLACNKMYIILCWSLSDMVW